MVSVYKSINAGGVLESWGGAGSENSLKFEILQEDIDREYKSLWYRSTDGIYI